MKRMQRVFGDLDALLFVDNRLDEERKAAFLAHLAEEQAEAERVATWSRQNDTIRATFAGVAAEPVPLWLRLGNVTAERSGPRDLPGAPEHRRQRGGETRLVEPRSLPRRIDVPGPGDAPALPPGRPRRSASIGVSATVLLIIGVLVLIGARTLLPQPSAIETPAVRADADSMSALVSRASDAHRTFALDPLRPVEIPASQQPLLDRWLQRRLAMAVRAPDLRAVGWTALGGRLVPGESGPAAYYVYESEPGERLGVYIGRSTAVAPPSALALDPMSGGGAVVSWVSGQTAYAVTVDRSLDWLSRNAEQLRTRVMGAPSGD